MSTRARGKRGWHTSVGCFLPWTKMKKNCVMSLDSVVEARAHLHAIKYESQLAFKGKYKSWNMEMGTSFANIRFHLVSLLAIPLRSISRSLIRGNQKVIKKFRFIHTSIFMRKHFEYDAMCALCMCPVESAPIPSDEYQIFKSNKHNSDKYFSLCNFLL